MFFRIRFLKNFANFTRKHLCWSLFKVAFRKCYRNMHKIGVIAIFTGKHLCWSPFQVWRPIIFLTKHSNTGVFYEICNIFKNTFFDRTPLLAATESPSESAQLWYCKNTLHSFLDKLGFLKVWHELNKPLC